MHPQSAREQQGKVEVAPTTRIKTNSAIERAPRGLFRPPRDLYRTAQARERRESEKKRGERAGGVSRLPVFARSDQLMRYRSAARAVKHRLAGGRGDRHANLKERDNC